MPVVVTLFRSGRTEGQPFTLDENNFAAKLMAGPPYQRSAAAYVFLHQDLPHISPISDKHDIFLNGRHLFSRHPLDSARLHNDDSIQIHTHPPFSFEEEHLIAVELDATIPPISARSPSPSPLPAPHSTSSTSAPTAPSFSSAQGHIAPSSHSRDCSLDDTAPPTFSYAAFVTPRPCSAPSISLTPSTPNMPSPGLGNTSGLTAVPAAISPASSSGPSSSSGLTSVLASNSSAASSSIILTTPAERFCAPTSHTSRPEYREPSTPSPHAQTTAACTQPCTTSLSYSAHAMVVSSSTSSTTLADSGSTSALDGALQSAVNETTDAIGGGRPTFHIGRYGGQRDVQHIPTNHARHSSVSDATRARTAEIAVGRVRTAWLEARQVGTVAALKSANTALSRIRDAWICARRVLPLVVAEPVPASTHSAIDSTTVDTANCVGPSRQPSPTSFSSLGSPTAALPPVIEQMSHQSDAKPSWSSNRFQHFYSFLPAVSLPMLFAPPAICAPPAIPPSASCLLFAPFFHHIPRPPGLHFLAPIFQTSACSLPATVRTPSYP